MTVTAVDVVNQALQQMGARASITSLSDGSVAANAANLLYTTQFNALARAAHWNCLRCQVAATLMRAAPGTPDNPTGAGPAPPYPWLYEYEWPDDCLAARFVIPVYAQEGSATPFTTGADSFSPWDQAPVTSVPFTPASDFKLTTSSVRQKVILTYAPNAQLVYTGAVTDPDLWDASFTNAFINVLAAWLVNPLNMDKSLLAQRVAVVKDLVQAARMSDGNENLVAQDHLPDWIAVRANGGGPLYSSWGAGPFIGAYGALALPGGVTF